METEIRYFFVLIEHFWVVLTIIGVLNGLIWWWRGRNLEADLKARHRQLVLVFTVWATVPFLLMGLTIALGGVSSILEYLVRPWNPYVLGWYILVLCMNGAVALWLLRGGSAEMVRMPNMMVQMPNMRNISAPEWVWRLVAVSMVVAPALALVALFLNAPRPIG